jgi:Flp pilus assembly protein TadB
MIASIIFLGLMYIFGAIVLSINEKRKNYIRRILRLSDDEVTTNSTKKGNKLVDKINIWLLKNNINLEIEEFFIIISILMSLLIVIGIFTAPNIIISFLLSIFLIFILFIFINMRKKKENSKKEIQLEQFLLDLKGNLYGNQNILNSLEQVVAETEYPLRKDFELVINDTRRGLLLDEALRKMVKKNSSSLIEIVLSGLIIANDKGADIISFLTDQIEYIREKRAIDNYIKILSTGPKYTAYLIMLIPVAAIIVIILINNNIIDIIFSSFGIISLVYVVLSNAVGIFLINRLLNYQNESRLIK